MARWIFKAAAQGAMSILPASQRINAVAQRFITQSHELSDDAFERKLAKCRHHVQASLDLVERDNPRILELGTGWHPVVPIGLALCGATSVLSVDRTRLVNKTRILNCASKFLSLDSRDRLDSLLPKVDSTRIDILRKAMNLAWDPWRMLEEIGIEFFVGNARKIPAGDKSIDFIVSNDTLEHIDGRILSGIFQEFRRLLAQDGAMSHFVNMRDHYAQFDSTISILHFLELGDPIWWLVNNRLQFQNRWRASDYVRLHQLAGFTIVDQHTERAEPDEVDIARLAARFRGRDANDLLSLEAWIFSRPLSSSVGPHPMRQ